MTIPGSANPLLLRSAAPTAYQVERSLRFNSSDSAYLSRTPASAGNRKTWTLSFWFKKAQSAATLDYVFGASSDGFNNNYALLALATQFEWQEVQGGSVVVRKTAAPAIRDHSAWMHILINFDTDNSTADDRFRIYINGTRITTFTPHNINPSLGLSGLLNNNIAHFWGYSNSSFSTNCYLADIHFIDGQALDPTSFTEVSATTGQLIPKAYTGTFGTNGFWLKFSDNSNNTATTLGKDYSPNGNNWTPNNLSVTAGAGNDSLVDTPTSYGTDTGAGGEVRGNYATFSPITTSGQGLATLANGNLDISGTGSNYTGCVSTIAVSSGKWYWEYTVTAYGSASGTGLVSSASLSGAVGGSYGYAQVSDGWFRSSTTVANNASNAVTGLSSIGTNDVINVAVDIDAGKLWFGRNGTWESSGNPASGTNATVTFTPGGKSFYALAQGYGTWSGVLNAGARSFAYTAPSGFKALCDTNLPTPVVAKPNTLMDVVLYTGTGAAQTITGLAFNPDFVWLKRRSSAQAHYLYDVIRGTSSVLFSDGTDAEQSISTGLTAFNSDGFSLGSLSGVNASSTTNVAWTWDAGTSTVTNTAGSITSSVRANASAGFSIVTYTGNGSSGATVGHGLGVAPAFFVVKRRNAADSWLVYHSFTGNTKYLLLNNATAAATYSGAWNDAGPSSTTITLGNDVGVNANGGTYVCYAWAPLSGYSSFGSYTGNGSTDGPFVYTGFRPRWVMVKCTQDIAGDVEQWVIKDTTRSTYNEAFDNLYANLSNAEDDASGSAIDILSNGFKLRGTYGGINGSAAYIYAAFAENPFQFSRAR